MRKIAALLLLLILAGAVAFCCWFDIFAGGEEGLKLYGQVDLRTANLAFDASGRIEKLMVEEGGRVKKGDTLAVLDSTRYAIALDTSAANINVLRKQLDLALAGSRPQEIDVGRAKLEAAKASYALSARTCEREKKLATATSIQKRDQACSEAAVYEAQASQAAKELDLLLAGTRIEEIDVARANLKQAEENWREAERQLKNCTLYAPADGFIRSRLSEPGEMVTSATPVFELAVMNPMWVRVWIDEVNLGRIKMGDRMLVTVDSYPGKVFEAKVGFISTVAEFTPKTVQTEAIRTSLVYEVRLTADDPEGLLRLGMPATARLAEQ